MVRRVSKPKVTSEETGYRQGLFPVVADIVNKNLLCTSCNSSVKELVLKGKPIVHPFLGTLLCEKCDHFFGDGQFSVDEDGSDKYCRWCGQGGTLYLCSTCTAGFCKRCIKRNLPRSALNEVEDDNWKCYCCNVKPLYALRANCWAAQEYAAVVKKKPSENSRKRKLEASSGGEDSSKEEKIKKNKSMKIEEEPHAKQTKKHIKAAAAKLSDFLGDTVTMIELVKKKGIEYKNKKATTRTLKNVDSVVDFAKKVDTMLENIEKSSMKMRENLNNFIESWKKSVEETSISSSENVEEIEAEEGRLEEKNKDIDIEGELKEVDKNGRGDEDDQKANSDREREVEEGNKEESEINSDTERTEEENVKGDRDESSVEIGVKKIAPPTDSTDEGPERSLVFDEAVTPVAGLNDNREESTGREKHERMETDKA